MSEVKHTPGPWAVEGPLREGTYRISSRHGLVAYVGNGFNIGCVKADANLIIAAPDLLEALQSAREFVQADIDGLLESSCHPHPETLEPIRDTADPEDLEHIEEVEAILAKIDAALTKAGAQ